jgi:hypothetical protein
VKTVVMESLTYPDVPLEQLSHELSATGGGTPSLLYQALFSFQDARQRITRWGGLRHENILVFQRGANEDLGMWFVESEGGLHGGITYNTEILFEATAQQLRNGFLAILDQAIGSATLTIADLSGALNLAPRVPQESVAATKTYLSAAEISPPTTPTQKLLASAWARLLGLDEANISVTDNFFDMGGHSLLALQALNLMEEQLGKRINPRRFIIDSLGQIALAYDEAPVDTVSRPRGLRGLLSRLAGSKGS